MHNHYIINKHTEEENQHEGIVKCLEQYLVVEVIMNSRLLQVSSCVATLKPDRPNRTSNTTLSYLTTWHKSWFILVSTALPVYKY
jgi:hypothetical protein